jgi:hypothetical protein
MACVMKIQNDTQHITARAQTTPHIFAAIVAHDIQQSDGAAEVIVVVFEWLLQAPAHSLEPSKMDDAVKPMQH